MQPFENLFQNLKVFLLVPRVHHEIVQIHEDALQTVHDVVHIFSDSPQFQHTAPQFSQAVLSLCVCCAAASLSL